MKLPMTMSDEMQMVAVAGPGGGRGGCDPVQVRSRLQRLVSSNAVVRVAEPLARRTTLRVGGPADVWVEPADEADLAVVLRFAAEFGIPVTMVGRGSNLLIRDGGVRGIVIGLGRPAFSQLEVEGMEIRAGAGLRLKLLAAEARRQGLAGLEFLDGIPGSVGGALRMNAGAMGSAVAGVVTRVRVMDRQGRLRELAAGELSWGYRHCEFFDEHLALAAVFRVEASTPGVVGARMDAYNAKRWESQPKESSAGCVFKNPPQAPAGRLVEECGLKGLRVGGARVSEVHGNFIVNEGGALAGDVLDLIERVRVCVRRRTGIELQTEVEIRGEDVPGVPGDGRTGVVGSAGADAGPGSVSGSQT